jgi:hypothetical protein
MENLVELVGVNLRSSPHYGPHIIARSAPPKGQGFVGFTNFPKKEKLNASGSLRLSTH